MFTEDELVSLDDLQEKVQEFEDYVQSTDIAAMQSTLIDPSEQVCVLIWFDRAVKIMYIRLGRISEDAG